MHRALRKCFDPDCRGFQSPEHAIPPWILETTQEEMLPARQTQNMFSWQSAFRKSSTAPSGKGSRRKQSKKPWRCSKPSLSQGLAHALRFSLAALLGRSRQANAKEPDEPNEPIAKRKRVSEGGA